MKEFLWPVAWVGGSCLWLRHSVVDVALMRFETAPHGLSSGQQALKKELQ
jgi:hypothetical protein